ALRSGQSSQELESEIAASIPLSPVGSRNVSSLGLGIMPVQILEEQSGAASLKSHARVCKWPPYLTIRLVAFRPVRRLTAALRLARVSLSRPRGSQRARSASWALCLRFLRPSASESGHLRSRGRGPRKGRLPPEVGPCCLSSSPIRRCRFTRM